MKYRANLGGHAPGHLREAFCDLVDLYQQKASWSWGFENKDFRKFLPKEIQGIFWDNKRRTIGWLLGQLWNCTDIMPSELCSDLSMVQGSTYAQAVRKLKAKIKADK